MDTLNGRPKLLKQANLSLIRKVITAEGTATRAEIARKTNISSTTVRSLLAEMLENGEIESLGFDESSGGRKAQRYGFKPDRYHGAAICLYDSEAYGLLVDVRGQILETTPLPMEDGMAEAAIFTFLDGLIPKGRSGRSAWGRRASWRADACCARRSTGTNFTKQIWAIRSPSGTACRWCWKTI